MTLVKARKVGNSLSVTLPKELGFQAGQEFSVEKGRNEVVMLIPKQENPFDGKMDLRMTDDFEGVIFNEDEY